MVAKNPNNELLYIWIKTEMFPDIPGIKSIENPEATINLSKRFKAKAVLAGMRLKCISKHENSMPICGGQYFAEFTGLKAIDIGD